MKTNSFLSFLALLGLSCLNVFGVAQATDPTSYQLITIAENYGHDAVNVVVTGDGMNTDTEKANLVALATRWYAAMTDDRFLPGYKDMVNMYVLWVPSIDQGISITAQPAGAVNPVVSKNTIYGAYSDQATSMQIGNQRVAWLNTVVPWRSDIVYVCNTDLTSPRSILGNAYSYLGGGITVLGSDVYATTDGVFVHETGHGLCNLGDEYIYPASVPAFAAPNSVSAAIVGVPNTKSALPWGALITSATVQLDTFNGWNGTGVTYDPTARDTYDLGLLQSTNTAMPLIGAYVGAMHLDWYKPYRHSLWNISSLGQGDKWWYEVGSVHIEAFIVSLHAKASSLVNVSPSNSSTLTTTTVFRASLRNNPTLTIGWTLDGVSVAPAADGSVTIDPATLSPGIHYVKVTSIDTTTKVRGAYVANMTHSVQWSVQSSRQAPVTPTPTPSSNGGGGGSLSFWSLGGLLGVLIARFFNRSVRAC